MINIVKIIFLFIGVLFTAVNTAKAIEKDRISFANFFWQTVGIVGFVVVQWFV